MLKKHKDRKEKNKELQKKYQAIKEKPVEEANTRIVNLKYTAGCGCGNSYDWIHGEVPTNSNINDGDYIDSLDAINNPKMGRYSG